MEDLDKLLASTVITEEYNRAAQLIDRNKFNPDDPDVLVVGVGKMRLSQVKKSVITNLEKAIEMAKADNFEGVNSLLSSKNILSHYISAVVDIQEELKKPSLKRKAKMMREAKAKKAQMASEAKQATQQVETPFVESAPPDKSIEAWIVKMKPYFKKHYGADWKEVLYSTAWSMYKDKQDKEAKSKK